MKKWQFWLLNSLAGVVLILVFVNISLFLRNRSVQVVVLRQQQFINDGIRLSRLNAQLIRALASVSAQTNDQQIRALLAEHGVKFSFDSKATQSEQQRP